MNFKYEEKITYQDNVEMTNLTDSKAGVYVFEIKKGDEYLSEKEVNNLKQLWRCRENEKVPRTNESSNNQWLYVGRDFRNINTRIKAHLGQGNKRTYALKLGAIHRNNTNYKNLGEKIKKYTITCYKFSINKKMDDIIKTGYIAMVEGILHERLKPILGKK